MTISVKVALLYIEMKQDPTKWDSDHAEANTVAAKVCDPTPNKVHVLEY